MGVRATPSERRMNGQRKGVITASGLEGGTHDSLEETPTCKGCYHLLGIETRVHDGSSSGLVKIDQLMWLECIVASFVLLS